MAFPPRTDTATVAGTRSPAESVLQTVIDAAVAPVLAMPMPMRAVIVGPAGSGKSAALRALRTELSACDQPVVVSAIAWPGAAEAGSVVLVDDADALSEEEAVELERLVTDPSASVIIAYREDAASARVERCARRLEHSAPPLLLGEVTALQIAEATRMPMHCADAIVAMTGALTSLVLAAVEAHDSGTCDADPTHRDLAHSLRGGVAHRMGRLDPSVRGAVEALCLFPPAQIGALPEPVVTWDAAIAAGWSAGLLARGGQAPSAVRAAVRHDLPVHRLAELVSLSADTEAGAQMWTEQTHAGPLPQRLLARADALRAEDPERAMALYGEALAAGADTAELGPRLVVAAVAAGDLDAATACVDRILGVGGHPHRGEAVDAALALWAARGALRAGVRAHGGATPGSSASRARRAIARLAAGAPLVADEAEPAAEADTLTVASNSLVDALRASLRPGSRTAGSGVGAGATVHTGAGASARVGGGAGATANPEAGASARGGAEAAGLAESGAGLDAVVDDLALASELYSAAHSDFPLVEPPAVVTAAAALATGRPATAAAAIGAAIDARQSGRWARPRLLLWSAWIALTTGHTDNAHDALARARDCGVPLQPRDRLIQAACETALARRYGSTAQLGTVYRACGPLLVRQRFDLFLHPFLAELVLAGNRVGTSTAADRAFAAELAVLAEVGDPPLWVVPLHWAGIQRGIVRNRPDLLVPHARALLTAAEQSPFAARLADAGRIWTDVLAGRVDVERVQSASRALARDGLTWDGARLAAHGAARSDDRGVAGELLACARDLHPRTDVPQTVNAPLEPSGDGTTLSARELEVAQLVVQGKTYVEIGQTLFISPRTAEHHIARIRRRLDAASRSDLIAKLHDVLGAGAPEDPT